MTQIRKNARGNALLAREPGALAGYATVATATPGTRAARLGLANQSPPFLPPCLYQVPAVVAERAPAGAGRSSASKGVLATLRDRIALFLASTRAAYRNWQERQAASAAWETLDERTLKDIGLSRDAMGDVDRPASCWERCNTVL